MNKKECVNLINELFEKLDDAKRQIFELETELAKKEESSEQQVQVEEVEETPEQSNEQTVEEPADDTVEEPQSETEKPEVNEEPKALESKFQKEEKIELPRLKASPAFSQLGEEVFYASEILGRIVVAATRYSNEIYREFTNDRANSLNDLILSKTSEAKDEILRCVMSNSDLDEKKIDIYNVYNSALDYFESVISQ